MSTSTTFHRLQGLLFVTIAIFFVATVYISKVVQDRQTALEKASHYDVAFSAGQGTNEYLRFVRALSMIVTAPEETSHDEAILRYEILLNRYQNFNSGDFQTFLETQPDGMQIIRDLDRMLVEIEPDVARLDQPGVARAVLDRVASLEAGLLGLTSEANSYGGKLAADTQHTIIRLHWLASGLAGGLVLSGLVLIGLLIWSNRLLRGTYGRLVQTADDLEQRTKHLHRQNTLFDAAINNMSQGLSMIGPSGDLIVSNRRLAEIYDLPPYLTASQTPIADIVRHCSTVNMADDRQLGRMFGWPGDSEQAGDGFLDELAVHELNDHRMIAVSHQPLDDGGWVTTHEDVTERRRAEAKIAYMAGHDTLTGLPNRVQFSERLTRALDRLRNKGERFAVLCFDLDRFKNVNDTLGHRHGDLLLQEVAERARALMHDGDVLSRFGGNEFAIIQTEIADEGEAGALAKSLLEAVGEPYDIEGHRVIVGASVGVSVVDACESDPDVVIKNADMALYRAKSGGGSLYRFFDAAMDTRLQERRALELDLWSAFEREEFKIAYQPVVRIEDSALVGVEALLRWHHPVRGLVPPDQFIPVAEDIGLIESLGKYVLETACNEVVGWPRPIKLAVNLSSLQFSRGDLVKTVAQALAQSGLPASRLELEITESLLVHENDLAVSILRDIRKLGVSFALDDFGTGYSSLSYIRRFPIQKIKIDKSFVSDVTHNIESMAIVRAVTALADSLGIETTAEGIETDEQLKLLHLAGCQLAQGYLFSPARPAPEIIAMLEESAVLERLSA